MVGILRSPVDSTDSEMARAAVTETLTGCDVRGKKVRAAPMSCTWLRCTHFTSHAVLVAPDPRCWSGRHRL